MRLFFYFCLFPFLCFSEVLTGLDLFFKEKLFLSYKGKKIGIITNHTARDKNGISIIERFKNDAKEMQLIALFSPEHGLDGAAFAAKEVENKIENSIPIYSLYGKTHRPTDKMLQEIDLLIFDIQDLGSRSYTYETTLFYIMEEAAKKGIEVIIFDRPNPLGGDLVDGFMLEKTMRSFIGYINIPYCHGMTIGELAKLFNGEYNVGCKLRVIPMKGWKRNMTFKETDLFWVPSSPHIPDAETAFFYPTTGALGELHLVSIGVGYTLPFKVIGAPWINADKLSYHLNLQKLSGVRFIPFHFSPFYGFLKNKLCHGVMIQITDYKSFRPTEVTCLLLGMLKSLYPTKVIASLEKNHNNSFSQAIGNERVASILKNEKYPAWELIAYLRNEREEFIKIRSKYLINDYNN